MELSLAAEGCVDGLIEQGALVGTRHATYPDDDGYLGGGVCLYASPVATSIA
jgi:hypothetical protein